MAKVNALWDIKLPQVHVESNSGDTAMSVNFTVQFRTTVNCTAPLGAQLFLCESADASTSPAVDAASCPPATLTKAAFLSAELRTSQVLAPC